MVYRGDHKQLNISMISIAGVGEEIYQTTAVVFFSLFFLQGVEIPLHFSEMMKAYLLFEWHLA